MRNQTVYKISLGREQGQHRKLNKDKRLKLNTGRPTTTVNNKEGQFKGPASQDSHKEHLPAKKQIDLSGIILHIVMIYRRDKHTSSGHSCRSGRANDHGDRDSGLPSPYFPLLLAHNRPSPLILTITLSI